MNHDSHVQLARLFARCTVNETGCWVWNGSRFRDGYAHIDNRPGHRVSWEIVNGPIPPGICACHHCDRKPCINPSHIFLGTHRDNMLDAVKKGRMARGDANGSRLHPERRPRGEANTSHIYPEKLRGERNGFARLKESQVVEIRTLRAAGVVAAEIASRFGIAERTVRDIVSGNRWGHVPFAVEEARRG